MRLERSITRRRALRWSFGVAAASLLNACGFQLRGANQAALPFKTIYLGFPENSPLGTQLRRYIQAGGSTIVVKTPQEAEANLEVLSETREKIILSLNSQGRVREYSLYYKFNFQLRDKSGKLLLAPTQIVLKRDISFNESQVLSKESEEASMYNDMQNDLVQQILRRLAALKHS
jgi:LPS-assembly lipoprotein